MSPRERSRATHNQSERIRSAEPPLSASFPASVDASSTVSMVRLSFRSMPCRLTTSSSQASVPVFCTATRIRSACALEAPSTIISKTRCGAHAKTMPQPTPVASCNTIRLSRRHTDGLDAECSTESMSKTRRDRIRVMFTMHSAVGLVVGLSLCYGWGAAAFGRAACQEITPKQFAAEATRTAKERLSGKSADEQRVDNCKVPLGSRGPSRVPRLCRSRSKPLKRRPKVDRLCHIRCNRDHWHRSSAADCSLAN